MSSKRTALTIGRATIFPTSSASKAPPDKVVPLECGGRIRIVHEFDIYELTPRDDQLFAALRELVQKHELEH